MASGKIILVATPIGNLGDLSLRVQSALAEADLWIVEDTRVSSKLASHLGVRKPMRVVNDHTNPGQISRILDEVQTGLTAVLLTDGGTPAISDPGTLVADGAYERGIEVDALPGPSAVTTALMLSGFFGQRFVFLGFLGRKPGSIRQELAPFADSPYTLVLFESPFRVGKTLEVAASVLGARRFATCREMTKLHQEVRRGILTNPTELQNFLPKGEYCLVIEGKRRTHCADDTDVLE